MLDRTMRRMPAIERSISEINPKTDIRIRIFGTVIDRTPESIVVDDGTGEVEVAFENAVNYVREGQFVRIIARVLPLIEGFECRGEVVQNLDSLDVKLYKDARKIIKR